MTRWIARRPDAPEDFDPGDLIVTRTDEERDQINEGISRYVAELERDTAAAAGEE